MPNTKPKIVYKVWRDTQTTRIYAFPSSESFYKVVLPNMLSSKLILIGIHREEPKMFTAGQNYAWIETDLDYDAHDREADRKLWPSMILGDWPEWKGFTKL